MRVVAVKRFFIFLVLVSIITPFSFAEESQSVRICKENFDKKIAQLNTQKDKLSELIEYSTNKQTVVQQAIDNLGDYRKKIIFLTKVNLLKSILKLGYDTYQEMSPLGGTSGKLIEIFAWFEGKAQDYVLNTTLNNKDYYNKHISFLSDKAKQLTPEIELLAKMQKAGLEAFKIKINREQNQTIGDVGALFAKLRNLSEQSLKAQTSLKQMNQTLLELINHKSIELNQIEKNILSYTDSKDRTCRDNNIPIEKDNASDIAVTISYSPQSPQCTSDEDAQATEDSLCAALQTTKKLENDFLQRFHDEFKTFYDNLSNEQNSTFQTVAKNIEPIDLLNLGYDECDLYIFGCTDAQCKLSNIIDNSRKQARNNYTLYNNYYKLLSSHKGEFKKFIADFLTSDIANRLKNSELTVDSLENKLSNCSRYTYIHKTCSDTSILGYYNVKSNIYYTVGDAQYSYYGYINGAKSLSLTAKELLDTKLDEVANIAQNCVKKDADYLPVEEDKMKNFENHIDEYIMAKENFLNFLANLKKEKMITYTSEPIESATYFRYDINYQYFKEMYDNFNGTDIEFFKMIQDTLRPIITDLSNLYNFFLSAETLAYSEAYSVSDYFYRNSRPVINVEDVASMKKKYTKLKENVPNTGTDKYDISNILRFGNNIMSGEPDFHNVIDITESIYQEIHNHERSLSSLIRYSNTLSNKNTLENFKKEIYSAESFAYNTQLAMTNNSDFSNLNMYVENAKNTLFQQAKQILPPEESSAFDLNQTVSPCKSQILDFNLSKEMVVITKDNNATLYITMNSCDGRGLSLIAEANDTSAISLKASWDQDFDKILPSDFTQNFYKNNSAKLTLSSKNNLDKSYNLTVKLLDKYDDIITKTIPIKVISSTTKKDIKKGWNLVSGNFDILNLSNNISIIWQYKDNYWYANSPYQNIKDLIKKDSIRSNIRRLSNSQNNDGIWILAKNDTDIDMFDLSEHANMQYKNGWSLSGVYEDTYIKDITCKEQDALPLIWKYSDGNWTNYSAASNTIKDTDMLNAYDGFWILCK